MHPRTNRKNKGFTILESCLMLVALGIFTVAALGLWKHRDRADTPPSPGQADSTGTGPDTLKPASEDGAISR